MTRVGLLGPDAASAAERIRDAGGDAVVGPDADDASVDVLVALDEDALLDALAAARDVPVLPVDTGREYGGVPAPGRTRALDALAAGDFDVETRQTLSVTVGDTTLRALADVTLVTTEAAQISEFAIRADGRDVDTVRADGVVAATPAGSHGYAADAGGPLLASDADVVAVVPIAPFRISRDRWVLAPPTSFTVVRDGPAVDLYVDGRELGPVAAHDDVELDWGEPFPVATVAGSRPEPTFD
ncbi:ATP-NAD kinase [Halobacterium wangiae]|uniref:ATP-NAD kinase n=1 Tax=Halobacterium wangiae TaxID=2902623 RepID=UPI001E5EACF0|nr:ATP-NAD kinase [Halobacterium wangiae]